VLGCAVNLVMSDNDYPTMNYSACYNELAVDSSTFQQNASALRSQCVAVHCCMHDMKLLIPGAVVAMCAVPFQEVVPEVPVLLGCSVTAAPVRLQEIR